ncbi:MAG: hypothetical protein GY748_16335 [Planctomycetaceae bacterium]|nr:hypothetical protein [Planctomycetaceae bacterium]
MNSHNSLVSKDLGRRRPGRAAVNPYHQRTYGDFVGGRELGTIQHLLALLLPHRVDGDQTTAIVTALESAGW